MKGTRNIELRTTTSFLLLHYVGLPVFIDRLQLQALEHFSELLLQFLLLGFEMSFIFSLFISILFILFNLLDQISLDLILRLQDESTNEISSRISLNSYALPRGLKVLYPSAKPSISFILILQRSVFLFKEMLLVS